MVSAIAELLVFQSSTLPFHYFTRLHFWQVNLELHWGQMERWTRTYLWCG